MRPLISLIIPVYNTEAYLKDCLDSVQAQTYDNFEIILVDDGSTDGSGALCDQYAAEDTRVRVFHTENRGVAAARNFAIDRAKGEYIAFADSDDYVAEDYLEYLYELLTRFDADIACTGIEDVYVERRSAVKTVMLTFAGDKAAAAERPLTVQEALAVICYGVEMGASPCGKLYRKGVFSKVRYPEGRIYEDMATTYKLFVQCDRIAFSDRRIYLHIYRQESTLNSPLNERKLYGFTAAEELLEFIKTHYPQIEDAAHVRCAWKAVAYVDDMLRLPSGKKEFFHTIRSYMMPHARYALRSAMSVGGKLKVITVMLGYYPTKLLWPLGNKLRVRHHKVA